MAPSSNRKRGPIEVIDLCTPPSSPTHQPSPAKRQAVSTKASDRIKAGVKPSDRKYGHSTASSAVSPKTVAPKENVGKSSSSLTSDITPDKPEKVNSEPADRATTTGISDVEHQEPKKFALKPGVWTPWSPRIYAELADAIIMSFNPVPFAKKHNKAIDEVHTVFTKVVTNALYHAAEATKRGEQGMQEIFDLFNKYGTPMRDWGNNEGKIQGELARISVGKVVLIKPDGTETELDVMDISDGDIEWLRTALSDEDLETLAVGLAEEGGDLGKKDEGEEAKVIKIEDDEENKDKEAKREDYDEYGQENEYDHLQGNYNDYGTENEYGQENVYDDGQGNEFEYDQEAEYEADYEWE